MSQLDTTISGGLYLDANGAYQDAWGNKVEPPSAAQPTPAEDGAEAKKSNDDKKKKLKEVIDE
jgi:hypothetical protein